MSTTKCSSLISIIKTLYNCHLNRRIREFVCTGQTLEQLILSKRRKEGSRWFSWRRKQSCSLSSSSFSFFYLWLGGAGVYLSKCTSIHQSALLKGAVWEQKIKIFFWTRTYYKKLKLDLCRLQSSNIRPMWYLPFFLFGTIRVRWLHLQTQFTWRKLISKLRKTIWRHCYEE